VSPRTTGRDRRIANRVDWGGDRRSVTVTYRYGSELRTAVAETIERAHSQVNRRFGPPDAVECVSSPRSIYNDLSGETARRSAAKGQIADFGTAFWGEV
jgi:hypothetical protein